MGSNIYLVTVKMETGEDTHAGISLWNSIGYPVYSGKTLCGENGILRRQDGEPTCKKCVANIARRITKEIH